MRHVPCPKLRLPCLSNAWGLGRMWLIVRRGARDRGLSASWYCNSNRPSRYAGSVVVVGVQNSVVEYNYAGTKKEKTRKTDVQWARRGCAAEM